jgi:putative sterol carrier protein
VDCLATVSQVTDQRRSEKQEHAVAQYEFLSDKWISAARAIRDEYADRVPDVPSMRMNLVVSEVPFGEGAIEAHVDSSSGRIQLDLAHIEKPDVTVTADYATVKALFVDQNPAAAMQAFMSGKIRVQGDLGKLMALQTTAVPNGADDLAAEVAERIKKITK